jgi:hypothetical protein
VLCSVVETLGQRRRRGVVRRARQRRRHQQPHQPAALGPRRRALQAVATPVHRGRTSQLWSVEVRDEQDRLIAKGELRVANLPAQDAPAT